MVETEASKGKRIWVDLAAGKATFGEWAKRWYKTTASLKPSTRALLPAAPRRPAPPTFERIPLPGINRMMVGEWIAALPQFLTAEGRHLARWPALNPDDLCSRQRGARSPSTN